MKQSNNFTNEKFQKKWKFIRLKSKYKLSFVLNEIYLTLIWRMPRQENNLIKEYVKQLKDDLNLIGKHKSSIIFTGLTGSGKGTLIHYLTKNRRLYARTS